MKNKKLEKQLGLWDVFAISTGAMFSSGFFLLPGIAAAETGPSVFLAYFFAGLLVLPTMFSVSELSTALPRAGGTYYFIDRSLGPVMGTIGGFGSWLALVLKSAFALIGMGAYLGIFFDLPITLIAVVLTVIFGFINIIGAKETTFLQKVLVASLLAIMLFYVVQGIFSLLSLDFKEVTQSQFKPFFINGPNGVLTTIGMVFVSYAGLTKVASVAEEIKNPDKNIPLGMILSLIVAMFVYVFGVLIMVALLEPEILREDLTPVATAGEVFLNWLPEPTGLILVVIAAIAAFASTGNAGIMSASRYPMAMARDKLLDIRFSKISSRFGTPVYSILGTVLLMVFFLVAFNVEVVAKLASAFQLLLFGLLNFAVIVMRESKIEQYDPGYKSPLYPWVQMAGIFISCLLILEMGLLSIIFTVVVSILSVVWYYYYGAAAITRQGAIYHVHERLGQYKDSGLEHEMQRILREKGLREEDPYELVVGRAEVFEIEDSEVNYEDIFQKSCQKLASQIDVNQEELIEKFKIINDFGALTLGHGAALHHTRLNKDIKPQLLLVRIKEGLATTDNEQDNISDSNKLYAVFFLVSSDKDPTQHLRFLAHLAEMVDHANFLQRWKNASDERELREILLRDERFITVKVRPVDDTKNMIGKRIKEIDLPGDSLITIIKHEGKIRIPHGDTMVHEGDELSIVGDKKAISELKKLAAKR